jgi:long-chain fatty acid transport protein
LQIRRGKKLACLSVLSMPIWGVSPKIVRADELMITHWRHASGVLVVLLSGVSALSVSANGFLLADQDAFATARGGAFVATADNASAVYYNPAGITQLEGYNFRGGLYGLYYDPTFSPPSSAANSGSTYHIEHQWAAAPQFFATYTPTDWPLSFGLGLYSPYGGDISWPQDTGFRSVALNGSLTYETINPVVALKLAPGLSIAGGVMVNYANLDMEQGLLASEMPTNFFRFKGDGWSAGYNLGLRWQPHQKVSLGATFRSTATVRLDGHTEFEQYPLRRLGLYPATNSVAHEDLTFPLNVVVGISYRPTPKWNLEFNADYTDWSSFGTNNLYQQNPPPRSGIKTNTPVILNWQGSWIYSFGVTRYFDNGWHVSAGYAYDENSVPNAYYTPLAADLDRHLFSIGVGLRGKRFDLDLAYQFGYGPAHTVTGSQPSSTVTQISGQRADGTYDFISHAIMLTVGLHF